MVYIDIKRRRLAERGKAALRAGGKPTAAQAAQFEWYSNWRSRAGPGAVKSSNRAIDEKTKRIKLTADGGKRSSSGYSQSKNFYYNPITKTYSTQKIAGQKPVSRTEAIKRTPTNRSFSTPELKRAASFTESEQKKRYGKVIVPQQQTSSSVSKDSLSPAKPVSPSVSLPGAASINLFEQGVISGTKDYTPPTKVFGQTPEQIRQSPISTGLRTSLPTVIGSNIRLFKEAYKEKGFKAFDPRESFKNIKTGIGKTKEASASFINVLREGKTFEESGKGTPQQKKTIKQQQKDLISLPGKGSQYGAAVATRLAVDTAVTIGTTSSLSKIGNLIGKGGAKVVGEKALTTGVGKVVAGTGKLGVYVAEAKGARAILTPYFEKTSDASKQDINTYVTGVNLLQAESFANIEGGKRVTQLVKASGKSPGYLKYMGTRLYPGFVEGVVTSESLLDAAGGKIESGIPFTEKSIIIGDGILPSKTKEGQIKTGRLLAAGGAGTFGALTASGFAGLEYAARGSKIGRGAVAGLGYGLDPAEAPGDIYTSLGGVSGKTFTIIPGFTPIKTSLPELSIISTASTTKSTPQTLIKGVTPSSTLTSTKATSSIPNVSLTTSNVPVTIKTDVLSTSDVDVPSTTQTNVPVETTTPVDTKVDIPAFTDVTVPAFTNVNMPSFTNTFVFTPKIPIIPPILPSGGGGSGKGFNFGFRPSRRTEYLPSLKGIVTKTKRKKKDGILSGLEVRGIQL